MGSEERERPGAGKQSLDFPTGDTLTAFRFYKATTEVYYRSPGVRKTAICCSLLEKTIGIFAGIPKQAIHTASSR